MQFRFRNWNWNRIMGGCHHLQNWNRRSVSLSQEQDLVEFCFKYSTSTVHVPVYPFTPPKCLGFRYTFNDEQLGFFQVITGMAFLVLRLGHARSSQGISRYNEQNSSFCVLYAKMLQSHIIVKS